jgi:hypothetical protein
VAGCCEYGDEPSGSGATELVSYLQVHNNEMRMLYNTSFLNTINSEIIVPFINQCFEYLTSM